MYTFSIHKKNTCGLIVLTFKNLLRYKLLLTTYSLLNKIFLSYDLTHYFCSEIIIT